MALELVYTSAARGLRAGTSGFCTVAMTKGFPPALVPRLEALGGYRAGPSGDGPLSYCFWRVETATGIAHVLSIVGPAPPDHTARTNKIATYLVLAPEELVAAGPAALLARAGLLRREWSGEPAWIEQSVRVPAVGDSEPRPCAAWQAAAGDAGWAGVLASGFLRDQSKPIHVIYGAGVDPLPLVDEAMRLLPDWARWRATFSTYFLQPVAGTPCAWRFCLEGTPAAEAARQSKGVVIDLTRAAGAAPDSRFTRMARTGVDEEAAAAAAAKTRASAVAAKKSADAAYALAPEAAVNEPPRRRLPLVITDDREQPAPEVPTAQPVKPVMIALVAAVLTLLVLLVIVLVSSGTRSKTGATEAGEQTAPASPSAAPAAEPAPQPAGPGVASMKAQPSTPEPEPAPSTPASQFGAEAPVDGGSTPPPSPPAAEPAESTASPAASSSEPTPAAAAPQQRNTVPPPSAPPAAPAQPAAPAPPAASAAAAPVAQWTMSFSGGDTPSARCDTPIAKARSARIVIPAELLGAGAKVGDRSMATFGAPTLRATPQVEGGIVKVVIAASGVMPESMAAVVGGRQADGKPLPASAAMQRALERCTVEVLDSAGIPLGSMQMRARMTKPIAFTAKAGKSPLIVGDVADTPLTVELLSANTGERPAVIASDRAIPGRSTELALGEWLRVRVNRAVQTSGIAVTASLPADVPVRRGAIATNLGALRTLTSSCIAVRDGAKGSRRGTSFDADLQAVQNALTDEEFARIAPGAARTAPLADAAAMTAAADAVQARTAAAVDAASRALAELSQVNAEKPKLPARIVVRIANDDGIVLLESEVKVMAGGGS